MMKQNRLAFVFPGQGSQQVGMLKTAAASFPLIQETFAQASHVLEKDLWKLIQEGPADLLNSTVNTQPALLTASVALWRVWQKKRGAQPKILAGHSLGEYSALVCANAMTLEDAAALVAKRGQLMQDAVPVGVGAMAAVLGLDDVTLKEICRQAAQGQVVMPANFNAIGQIVIAGNKEAVERAAVLAKEKGAKRVLPLPVSVPSHCELMRGAALLLAHELESIKIVSPTIPVVHNYDLENCSHPDDIRERLVNQLYHPVRWVETIQHFKKEGIQTIVECGPGKVLTGLIKRIDTECTPMGIETPEELEIALTHSS